MQKKIIKSYKSRKDDREIEHKNKTTFRNI